MTDYDDIRAATAKAEAGLKTVSDALAALQAKYDAYVAAHPDTPTPVPTPTPTPAPTPPTRFLVGMAYGGNADPAPVEQRWGIPVAIRRTYYGGSSTEVTKAITHIKANITAKRSCSEISFKLPYSWAQMATGSGDAWAKDIAAKIKTAIAGTTHLVKVIFHHEPENDTGTNDGSTTAGRDAWKNMQNRLAPFFDGIPGVEYGVCLMGYHSFYGTTTMKGLWNPDACVPKNKAIKFVSFDIYQRRLTTNDSGTVLGWTNMEGYYTLIKAFIDKRTTEGYPIKWGLSETGIIEAALDENPVYLDNEIKLIKQYGGSWYSYFNTNLNSTATWAISAGDSREIALGKLVKANA